MFITLQHAGSSSAYSDRVTLETTDRGQKAIPSFKDSPVVPSKASYVNQLNKKRLKACLAGIKRERMNALFDKVQIVLAQRHAAECGLLKRLDDKARRITKLEDLLKTLPPDTEDASAAHSELTDRACTFDEEQAKTDAFMLLAKHLPTDQAAADKARLRLWNLVPKHIKDPERRAEIRGQILFSAGAEMHASARTNAHTIQDECDRADAYIALAERLPPDKDASVEAHADLLKHVADLHDGEDIARVLVSLAENLPAGVKAFTTRRGAEAASDAHAAILRELQAHRFLLNEEQLAPVLRALAENPPPLQRAAVNSHLEIRELAYLDIKKQSIRYGFVYRPLLEKLPLNGIPLQRAYALTEDMLKYVDQLVDEADKEEGKRLLFDAVAKFRPELLGMRSFKHSALECFATAGVGMILIQTLRERHRRVRVRSEIIRCIRNIVTLCV